MMLPVPPEENAMMDRISALLELEFGGQRHWMLLYETDNQQKSSLLTSHKVARMQLIGILLETIQQLGAADDDYFRS